MSKWSTKNRGKIKLYRSVPWAKQLKFGESFNSIPNLAQALLGLDRWLCVDGPYVALKAALVDAEFSPHFLKVITGESLEKCREIFMSLYIC